MNIGISSGILGRRERWLIYKIFINQASYNLLEKYNNIVGKSIRSSI